jgi:gas vesicle protein
MHKGQDYSEKLEAYLRNELSESERAEFEQLLQQDPLLQNELTLQQDIIASICTYRKSELKQRLNRIDVRDTGKGNIGTFTVGGLVVGGLAIVGMAGLLMMNNSGKELSNAQLSGSIAQVQILADSNKQTIAAAGSAQEITPASDVDMKAANTEKNAGEKKTAVSGKVKKVSAKKVPQIKPVLPSDEIGEELLKEQEVKKEHELVMPETRNYSSINGSGSGLIIVDNNSGKYKLHYKYVDGQLFLYGLDKPYNILDLPNHRYIYHDGQYYKLNRNQPQIVPMPQVIDSQEVKLVESYKQRMNNN